METFLGNLMTCGDIYERNDILLKNWEWNQITPIEVANNKYASLRLNQQWPSFNKQQQHTNNYEEFLKYLASCYPNYFTI